MITITPPLKIGDVEFPVIKRTSVTDQANEGLLDLVRRGLLRAGERLPSQRQLVSRMGLSQTAVREALRGLSTIGVIETRPGHGTFVRSISPEMLVRPESLFFVLERDTLLHAIDVRRILEVEAIGLAAELATPNELAEMESILRLIQKGLNQEGSEFLHSAYFHFAIAKATHNPILLNLIKPFIRLIMHHSAVVGARHPQAREIEYRSHADLLESIVKRDPEEARRRMRLHLEESRKMVLQAFSELPSQGGNRNPDEGTTELEQRESRQREENPPVA